MSMLYSNSRKLLLSGWLQKHDAPAYCSPLRLQKYLFLYEAFSKVAQDHADFSRLKGYKRGPVFSPVWEDYTKNRNISDIVAHEIDEEMRSIINDCYNKTKKIIKENKDLLELIANTLLEEETITKEQIDSLVKYGHLPKDDEKDTKEDEEKQEDTKKDNKEK